VIFLMLPGHLSFGISMGIMILLVSSMSLLGANDSER
jgi:hypothetical protein